MKEVLHSRKGVHIYTVISEALLDEGTNVLALVTLKHRSNS